jgi:hypothetical protein
MWYYFPAPRLGQLSQVPDLFRLFDSLGAAYAFAALGDELDSRNTYNWRSSIRYGGQGTSGIGRNFLKHVPGLYWMNYFS